MAVARSIYSHLPPNGTPLSLGFKKVDNADPAAVPAVPSNDRRTHSTLPAVPDTHSRLENVEAWNPSRLMATSSAVGKRR